MKNPLEFAFAHTVARMLVDCMHVIHADAYAPKHIGAAFEEMFVSFAIHIGTAEDRPMSATKVAGFLGIPRTNVLRALAQLRKKDIIYSVGNVYLTNVDRLTKRITPTLIRKQMKTIAQAQAELAKLELSALTD